MHDFKKNGEVYSLLADFILAASNGSIRLECAHQTGLPESSVSEKDYRSLSDAFNREGIVVGMEFSPYNIPGNKQFPRSGQISFTGVDEKALAAAVEKHAVRIAEIKAGFDSYRARHGW